MGNPKIYRLSWDGDSPTLKQVIGCLPRPPYGMSWRRVLREAQESRIWENHQADIAQVSLRFPGVLFQLEIKDLEEGISLIQYHQDGLHYQEEETRSFPPFDRTRLQAELTPRE